MHTPPARGNTALSLAVLVLPGAGVAACSSASGASDDASVDGSQNDTDHGQGRNDSGQNASDNGSGPRDQAGDTPENMGEVTYRQARQNGIFVLPRAKRRSASDGASRVSQSIRA